MDQKVETMLSSLSIIKELKEENATMEIALKEARNNGFKKRERECWLDGSQCPYGNPEGRFDLRPQSFCCNCQKVSDIRDELEEMFFGPDGPPASIDDWRSTHKPTTITMALTAILGKDGNEFDEDEKILVKAVIEMLEGGTKDYNPEIFYADDLPE